MSTKKEYTITEAIEALAPQIDPELDIVQVRILNVGKSVKLRVYVDYPGGVTFDVLKTSQAWISELLDELDPFKTSYTLEVSSPGINRPLTKPKHFINAVGKNIKLKTNERLDNRANFTGELKHADDKGITIKLVDAPNKDKSTYTINYDQISSANLKGDI